jgi:hypothetical protein
MKVPRFLEENPHITKGLDAFRESTRRGIASGTALECLEADRIISLLTTVSNQFPALCLQVSGTQFQRVKVADVSYVGIDSEVPGVVR